MTKVKRSGKRDGSGSGAGTPGVAPAAMRGRVVEPDEELASRLMGPEAIDMRNVVLGAAATYKRGVGGGARAPAWGVQVCGAVGVRVD